MNFKGVTRATWIRVIVMVIVLVNQISISFFNFQILPFTEEQIYEGVSLVLTTGITLWVGWKNNSFTDNAQDSDKYLDELREQDRIGK